MQKAGERRELEREGNMVFRDGALFIPPPPGTLTIGVPTVQKLTRAHTEKLRRELEESNLIMLLLGML